MPKFAYEARNESGELVSGFVSAESVELAGRLLSDRNLFVVRMGTDRANAPRVKEHGRASRADVAWCMSQLSVMMETGMLLSEALQCLSRQVSDPKLRRLLQDVSKSLQEGRSLSQAMDLHPRSFPPTLRALIRASEMSGSLSKVLRRSTDYLMNDLRAIKQIRGAMMYPLFMFLMCIGVTIFLLTVILQKFVEVFETRGAALPGPTLVLMAISDNLVNHWVGWVLGTIAAVTAVVVWTRTAAGKRHLDHLALATPVVSNLFNALYQSRTFQTIAILLEYNVPLPDTVAIAREVVSNSLYQDLWKRVDEHIRRGDKMSTPLLDCPFVSEPVALMIDAGERSGQLALVFARLGEFLEDEYNRTLKTSVQFIEPCMILFLGTLVGFIAAALMLPLFQASQIAGH